MLGYDRCQSQTRHSQVDKLTYAGVEVVLTDAPGFLDSRGNDEALAQLRDMAIQNSATSYHAILYCVRADGKFDLAEQAVLEVLRILYGPDTFKYVIFVLTRGDLADNLPSRVATWN